MNLNSKSFFQWPEMPPLPRPGEPALVRVATQVSRAAARHELRAVLREVLAAWSGLTAERLPLRETPRGPQWQGLLAGETLDISLSYCDGEAWIGLVRGGDIGIDAMLVRPVAEAEAVARHYLGPNVLADIRGSRQTEQTFALAWTKLEACFKCLKLELTEWNTVQVRAFAHLTSREMVLGRTAVTVAVSD